jgi:hypothetical protein
MDWFHQYTNWWLVNRWNSADFCKLGGYRSEMKSSLPKVVRRQRRASTEHFLYLSTVGVLLSNLSYCQTGALQKTDALSHGQASYKFKNSIHFYIRMQCGCDSQQWSSDMWAVFLKKFIAKSLLVLDWCVTRLCCATNWFCLC